MNSLCVCVCVCVCAVLELDVQLATAEEEKRLLQQSLTELQVYTTANTVNFHQSAFNDLRTLCFTCIVLRASSHVCVSCVDAVQTAAG